MNAVSSNLVKTAVHQNPLMSRQGIMQRMFSYWFDGFVYNQIWEDPRVDLEALKVDETSEILTISSGGCNILNYLLAKPKRIVAVDLNRYHMYLTRLKLNALQRVPSYEQFYDFFGYANRPSNLAIYERYIRKYLDEPTQQFWEEKRIGGQRIQYFADGFYKYARFGYYMRLLHKISQMTRYQPERIIEAQTLAEQEQIFAEEIAPFFDYWLVKGVGNKSMAVFSLGIPPQQYKYMKEESDGQLVNLYRDRVRRLACQFPIQDNYFAWQGFTLHYDHEHRQAVPDYLKAAHYETLKSNLYRVETHIASLIEYLKQQPEESLDRFVLLDSQDWMTAEVMTDLWTQIARVGKPGTRIIFRTASPESPIETALPPDLRARFNYEEAQSKAWFQQDRSAIYGGFHVYAMPSNS